MTRKRATRGVEDPRNRDSVRLQAVVNTAVDGIILIDAQGVIIMFNPACERLFGYRDEEVIGKNVKVLMTETFQMEHDRYIDNYITTGHRKVIGIGRQVEGRRKDGSVFPMDLSVGESREDGERFFVGIIHDVTGRRRTQEQLAQAQKMESIGQLSGGIAHDFNNLLTVIIGNAEALGRRLGGQTELQQLCDAIFAAGERGAELTRHLLAFSRRQVLQPVAVDCVELLQDMQRLLERTLRDDIELTMTAPAGVAWALADRAQLESAILNLALNAQDAMPRGGELMISARVTHLDHSDIVAGDYLQIDVSDTGIGMSEDVVARAFEPFFTTKEVGRGSGLGLSMVYGFVRQSSGHVEIISAPDKGATVRLYLPIAPAGVRRHRREGRGERREPPRGTEHVLVVEDDGHVRAYVVGLLTRLGYKVLTATNGEQALRLLEAGAEADLLFTDIVMPGISGFELAERAKVVLPGLRVLFTSGYPLDSLEESGHAPIGAEILMKPYRKIELATRLREVLDPKI